MSNKSYFQGGGRGDKRVLFLSRRHLHKLMSQQRESKRQLPPTAEYGHPGLNRALQRGPLQQVSKLNRYPATVNPLTVILSDCQE